MKLDSTTQFYILIALSDREALMRAPANRATAGSSR